MGHQQRTFFHLTFKTKNYLVNKKETTKNRNIYHDSKKNAIGNPIGRISSLGTNLRENIDIATEQSGRREKETQRFLAITKINRQ